MWLSRKIVYEQPEGDTAALGTVTIGGDDAAVMTDGERRNAKVISPGGYCWQPAASDSVLVLKGNELYVPGMLQTGRQIAPGEVLIYSDEAQIRLTNDGKVKISGDVYIDGDLYVNNVKMEVP